MSTTAEPTGIAPPPEAEQQQAYEDFAKTGEVSPSGVQKEDALMRRLSQPTSKPVVIDDYDDKHVRVCATKRTLTVKHWLLTHSTLTIDLDKIVYVLPAKKATSKAGVSAWGTGITAIGWARDFHRLFPAGKTWEHSYVCKYREPYLGLRAGFTVTDPERFLYTLEKLEPGIHTKVLPEGQEFTPPANKPVEEEVKAKEQ